MNDTVEREDEVSSLSVAWDAAWDSIVNDVERNRSQLRAQLKFYEDSISEDEKRLQNMYATVNEIMDREWQQRKNQIDNSIGKAISTFEKLLDQESKGNTTPEQLRAKLHEVDQKQVPLYELTNPSPNSQLLQDTLQEFDRLYAEWNKTAIETGVVTPPKRRLISRIKSKVRGLFVRKSTPPVQQSSRELKQYQRGLELRLIEIATTYVRTLRLLMTDIVKDARARWERQKRARLAEEEKKTGIARLKQAAAGIRLALETRERALHRARSINQQRKAELEKNVEETQNQIDQQIKLISQTQEQQQPQPVLQPLNVSSGRRLFKTKREYPEANSLEFGKELRRLYPDLYMNPTSVSEGSRCVTYKENEVPRIKPYQELFSRILTVDSPYSGFLAYHGTGSGKTRLGWETISRWFLDNIALRNTSPGAPVLILLPTNKLIGNWAAEGRKVIDSKLFTVRNYSKTDNTAILELVPNPTEFGKNVKPAYVILQKMTVLPDAAAIRIMSRNLPSDQELIEGTGYYLKAYDYDVHEAYRDLTPQEKEALKRMHLEQEVEVGSRTKVMVPSKTLVVVDEGHNLPNPAEISRNVIMSRTALAWANLLKKATSAKRLILTATPLLDDNKLTDLFKLLNLLQMNGGKQVFEGTWRTSLPSDAPDILKEAANHADELESRYLQQQLFDTEGSWQPGRKGLIQQFYAGMISYLTLNNDPTVYPALDTTCQQNPQSTCSYLWNVARQDLDELSVDELSEYGLPKPLRGKNVLVPMTTRQYKEMDKAIQSDLASWKAHRRLDAEPTEPPAVERLNFSGSTRTSKASVMQSWGMKAYTERGRISWPQKAYSLLHLMKNKFPNDKFFVYTSSQAQWFSTQLSRFLTEVGQYEVWTIAKIAEFVRTHPAESQGDNAETQLARAWQAENKEVGKKRVLMFIGSTSALEGLTAARQALVRDLMIELYNQPTNINGELFQAFVGDRNTKEGISLFLTMHVVFVEPSANATMQTQAESRVLRFCALSRFPFDRWRNVQLWRMISIPPSPAETPARAARNRKRPRTGGEGSSNKNVNKIVNKFVPAPWRPPPLPAKFVLLKNAAPTPIYEPWKLPAKAVPAPPPPTVVTQMQMSRRFGVAPGGCGIAPPVGRRWRAVNIKHSKFKHQGKTTIRRVGRTAGADFARLSARSCEISMRLRQLGGGWRRMGGAAVRGAPTVGAAPRTNEEWHYLYLSSQRPASVNILQALKEVAIDCLLFRDYNGDPTVRLCYGQTPVDVRTPSGQLLLPGVRPAPRLPRFDRFCATSEYLLLQDEDDTSLTEFSTNSLNPEGIRLADSFERRCDLANTTVVMLKSASYRDFLIIEALKAPIAVNLNAIERIFGVQQRNVLIIKEILQMLAKPPTGSEAAEQWSLKQDLKLWMLVSALSDESGHRSALERFVQHRIARLNEEQQRKFAGMAEQITSWMKMRLELDIAYDTLINFLRQIPTFNNLFLFLRPPSAPPSVPPPLAFVPRVQQRSRLIPQPSAPTLSDLD